MWQTPSLDLTSKRTAPRAWLCCLLGSVFFSSILHFTPCEQIAPRAWLCYLFGSLDQNTSCISQFLLDSLQFASLLRSAGLVLLRSFSGHGPYCVLPTSRDLFTTGSQGGSAPPTALCAAFLPSGCVEFCRGQCRYRSVPSVSSVSHLLRLVCRKPNKKNKKKQYFCQGLS